MYRTAGVNPAGSGSSAGLPASPVPDGLARQAEKPCSGRPVRFAVTPRLLPAGLLLCLRPPFRPVTPRLCLSTPYLCLSTPCLCLSTPCLCPPPSVPRHFLRHRSRSPSPVSRPPPFSPALAHPLFLPSPAPVSPRRPPVARSPKFSGKRRRRGLTHSFFVLCSFVQNVAACDVGFIDSKKEGTCLVPDIAAM